MTITAHTVKDLLLWIPRWFELLELRDERSVLDDLSRRNLTWRTRIERTTIEIDEDLRARDDLLLHLLLRDDELAMMA